MRGASGRRPPLIEYKFDIKQIYGMGVAPHPPGQDRPGGWGAASLNICIYIYIYIYIYIFCCDSNHIGSSNSYRDAGHAVQYDETGPVHNGLDLASIWFALLLVAPE